MAMGNLGDIGAGSPGIAEQLDRLAQQQSVLEKCRNFRSMPIAKIDDYFETGIPIVTTYGFLRCSTKKQQLLLLED